MAESRQRTCVHEINFYRETEKFKGHLKTKKLTKKNYLEDDFWKKRPNISAFLETKIDLSRNN